jgi:predicted DsbA family dithiol-disulfide isomerase
MSLNIRVYSDYVCPFCFIAEAPLEEAIKGKDVEIEWMPFELRPFPNPTLEPEGNYLQNTWRNSVYPTAERFGVKIVLPNVSPQPYTHLAFEGFQFAKEQGKSNAYNQRIMKAFFQEEKDIGQIDVLTQLAIEVGLNGEEFKAALATRKYKEAHQKALHHAYEEAKITAVPTFIIGDRVLPGLYSKDTLERVIAEEIENNNKFVEGMVCGTEGCE